MKTILRCPVCQHVHEMPHDPKHDGKQWRMQCQKCDSRFFVRCNVSVAWHVVTFEVTATAEADKSED